MRAARPSARIAGPRNARFKKIGFLNFNISKSIFFRARG